jgi:two-component system, OmpR family, sensor kinase
MASLRARVLASVLALAAIGLVALGAVTYTEQRSFLQGRVDDEVRSAEPAVSRQLDGLGFNPGGIGANPDEREDARHGPPSPNLPAGTYGQRRDSEGHVLGGRQLFTVGGESSSAKPALPARIPIGKLFTVGSAGSSGLQYRVLATRDPEDSGITLVAVPTGDVEQTLHRLLLVEALVIAGVLAALGLTAYFVVKLGLRPLDRIEVTAGEIAGGELSRRVSPATSRTEVGRLGLALNAMLDRLEQAFEARTESEDRLRRFLSDASHELRTPLASIRGYAELYRMGATESAADIALAMRRIEDESKRMGVLVEDLLALARLDEAPDRAPEPLDLALLAGDAVDDARATAPERSITLSAPEHAPAVGDPAQLRQVLANLLRNALVHTPAGTAIEVAVEPLEDGTSIAVRDHGPGISPDARARLFERFWRSERGRERGRAGAGLGLAIVHAIVESHGGRIAVEDAPGGGALFRVWLPAGAERAART